MKIHVWRDRSMGGMIGVSWLPTPFVDGARMSGRFIHIFALWFCVSIEGK